MQEEMNQYTVLPHQTQEISIGRQTQKHIQCIYMYIEHNKEKDGKKEKMQTKERNTPQPRWLGKTENNLNRLHTCMCNRSTNCDDMQAGQTEIMTVMKILNAPESISCLHYPLILSSEAWVASFPHDMPHHPGRRIYSITLSYLACRLCYKNAQLLMVVTQCCTYTMHLMFTLRRCR